MENDVPIGNLTFDSIHVPIKKIVYFNMKGILRLIDDNWFVEYQESTVIGHNGLHNEFGTTTKQIPLLNESDIFYVSMMKDITGRSFMVDKEIEFDLVVIKNPVEYLEDYTIIKPDTLFAKIVRNIDIELKKCMESPYYFATNYYKINTINGLMNFETELEEKEFNRLFYNFLLATSDI